MAYAAMLDGSGAGDVVEGDEEVGVVVKGFNGLENRGRDAKTFKSAEEGVVVDAVEGFFPVEEGQNAGGTRALRVALGLADDKKGLAGAVVFAGAGRAATRAGVEGWRRRV